MAENYEVEQSNQTHQTLQEVSRAIDNGMFVHVRRMLEDMEPEDIAHLLEASPPKSRLVLWQLTDPEEQGEILEELSKMSKMASWCACSQSNWPPQPKAWTPMTSLTCFEAFPITCLKTFLRRWIRKIVIA